MTLPNPVPSNDPASLPKGEPRVVSDTEGEDITPENPEIVKMFPVDTTNQDEVDRVEGTEKVNDDDDK
jgi:hypothetical protein